MARTGEACLHQTLVNLIEAVKSHEAQIAELRQQLEVRSKVQRCTGKLDCPCQHCAEHWSKTLPATPEQCGAFTVGKHQIVHRSDGIVDISTDSFDEYATITVEEFTQIAKKWLAYIGEDASQALQGTPFWTCQFSVPVPGSTYITSCGKPARCIAGNWYCDEHIAMMAPFEEGTPNRPTIVTLCGSTSFSDAFQKANFDETLAGRIVLTVGCDTKSDDELFATMDGEALDQLKIDLDNLHRDKIDLSDEILVLNVNGYVGDSTAREIRYAHEHGKVIRWLEPDKAIDAATAAKTGTKPEPAHIDLPEDITVSQFEHVTVTHEVGGYVRINNGLSSIWNDTSEMDRIAREWLVYRQQRFLDEYLQQPEPAQRPDYADLCVEMHHTLTIIKDSLTFVDKDTWKKLNFKADIIKGIEQVLEKASPIVVELDTPDEPEPPDTPEVAEEVE